MESPPLRDGSAKTMDFEVLIHLDHILDYSTPPSSPGGHNYNSNTSGILDDQLEPEFPVRYPFVWRLGTRMELVRVEVQAGSRCTIVLVAEGTGRRRAVVRVVASAAPEVGLVVQLHAAASGFLE
jgi:hypothetical protein